MKTLVFHNWKDFQIEVNNTLWQTYYWRGQRDPKWPLASLFQRRILALKINGETWNSQIFPYDNRFSKDKNSPEWQDWIEIMKMRREGYLEYFRQAISGLRGANPKELKPNEIWALGRHYGLVTPLLDWTQKPYIAVFFALADYYNSMIEKGIDKIPSGDSVAIYRFQDDTSLDGSDLKIITPNIDELGRLQGQRGLFTWLDSWDYFELQGFLDDTGRGDLLTQMILPSETFIEGFRDLASHGIDYRLLVPDLAGAALSANFSVEFLMSLGFQG